jgi:hypothetical protein
VGERKKQHQKEQGGGEHRLSPQQPGRPQEGGRGKYKCFSEAMIQDAPFSLVQGLFTGDLFIYSQHLRHKSSCLRKLIWWIRTASQSKYEVGYQRGKCSEEKKNSKGDWKLMEVWKFFS